MEISTSIRNVSNDSGKADVVAEARRQTAFLKAGALQNAILNGASAHFPILSTNEKGILEQGSDISGDVIIP